MPSERIIQLRQQLAEKIPNLRLFSETSPKREQVFWPTGIPQIDGALSGGLPQSAITELIAQRPGCGSAMLIAQLLRQTAAKNQFMALIDGQDSLDVASIEQSTLNRLLWIRCQNASEAVKAADLVLRDGNLQIVLLDLALNPEKELRNIPAPTWYRFQRIIEESSSVFIAITPRPMIAPAQVRLALHSRFDLSAFDCEQSDLLQQLDFEISDSRRLNAAEKFASQSA
jgi:hypothetical protein